MYDSICCNLTTHVPSSLALFLQHYIHTVSTDRPARPTEWQTPDLAVEVSEVASAPVGGGVGADVDVAVAVDVARRMRKSGRPSPSLAAW